VAKKKKKGAKAPKRIAGVKVPKPLREPAGKVVEALKNPVVADLAATALVAAAAALRDRPGAPTAAAAAGESQAKSGAALLGNLLAAKAIEGMRKLGEERERAAAAGKSDRQA
jgi:hypothetical protein